MPQKDTHIQNTLVTKGKLLFSFHNHRTEGGTKKMLLVQRHEANCGAVRSLTLQLQPPESFPERDFVISTWGAVHLFYLAI